MGSAIVYGGFAFPKGDCTAPRLFFDCRAFYGVVFEPIEPMSGFLLTFRYSKYGGNENEQRDRKTHAIPQGQDDGEVQDSLR